jgi:hypothetical protein
MVRGRFNSHHICRLREIADLPGFTGTASVGVALEAFELGPATDGTMESNVERAKNDMSGSQEQVEDSQEQLDLQEEEEEEEEEEALNNDLVDILTVTMDRISMNK